MTEEKIVLKSIEISMQFNEVGVIIFYAGKK